MIEPRTVGRRGAGVTDQRAEDGDGGGHDGDGGLGGAQQHELRGRLGEGRVGDGWELRCLGEGGYACAGQPAPGLLVGWGWEEGEGRLRETVR